MKHYMKLIVGLLAASLLLIVPMHAQTAMTVTTITADITDTSATTVFLTSATNVQSQGYLYIDGEAMLVMSSYVSGSLNVPVRRAASSTRAALHANGTLAYVVAPGLQARTGMRTYSPSGVCTRTNETVLPVINVLSGDLFDCQGSQWGQVFTQYVPPTQCSFAPTTSTVTNTYIMLGASNAFVLNGTTNAAAGTTTLVCTILPPTSAISQRGAVITDIVVAIGSQTTAPTTLGTSTLSKITYPTPVATTQTASTVTPVTISGTVTTLGPTTTVATVTTAGAFLTFKHTYATPVILTTDLTTLQYTFPFNQSAAAVMTLNTPGLWVHYLFPIN
jgi:hypothetical protein